MQEGIIKIKETEITFFYYLIFFVYLRERIKSNKELTFVVFVCVCMCMKNLSNGWNNEKELKSEGTKT